jgi:hypothetical protein
MKTIAIDIKHSVFNNDTEAIMYVIKDDYEWEDSYIIAIPVITFSWEIKDQRDYDDLVNSHVFGDSTKRELDLSQYFGHKKVKSGSYSA